jgi:phage shock protein PspC (stress-responsive transcriptional regulator)
MKKVININFQGQVIAIEETAYEILKQYIESLKKYFSQEDGGDEIVNDIENRIAELFGNRLKLGINCITDDDVESIINSIGRPEDFDTEYKVDSESESKKIDEEVSEESELKSEEEPRTLNRNSKDQIIGGVCSGVAHYFKIDPTWIRLLFVIFFGILFWVYIILWIVLKAKPLESNVTKRLYRNPNDKYIAGICGGIAAYFKIESWIPRLIFILPLFINIFGRSIY